MEYRSVSDLSATIRRNLHRTPRDVEVVVGVPRSGILAASMVSLALNLPLADLDGFLAGRLLASGRTRRRAALDTPATAMRRALVVDDSVRTGAAAEEARRKLAAACPDIEFTFCAVYGTEAAAGAVDLVFEMVPEPRVFEWNVLHHPLLAQACVDIDGVLCVDPTPEDNDDGENYLRFLQNAQPLHTPTRSIGTLVTSRLERYRKETEAWLEAAGVQYGKLVMLDGVDSETRRREGLHGKFKGEYYRRSPSPLFIESDPAQAAEIARISGKNVLCTETFTLFRADEDALVTRAQQARRTLPNKGRALAKRLLGPAAYAGLKQLAGRR